MIVNSKNLKKKKKGGGVDSPIMRLDTGINLDATCNLKGDFES